MVRVPRYGKAKCGPGRASNLNAARGGLALKGPGSGVRGQLQCTAWKPTFSFASTVYIARCVGLHREHGGPRPPGCMLCTWMSETCMCCEQVAVCEEAARQLGVQFRHAATAATVPGEMLAHM
jgi:hypothetical protein